MTDVLKQVREASRLSEEEFVEKCLSDMMGGWVPLSRYLKLYPEDSANKVHKRVQQGEWKRQVHYAAPKGGFAWVNLKAVRLWIEGQGLWCCAEGERLGVPICPTCSETTAAYSAAMGPSSAGTRSGG